MSFAVSAICRPATPAAVVRGAAASAFRSLSSATASAPPASASSTAAAAGTPLSVARLPDWQGDLTTYTRALVRGIAPDFAAKAVRQKRAGDAGGAPAIDQKKAEAQHAAYTAALSKCVEKVISIPAAQNCPDSVFVEDTAVVVGKTALISRPGHASRRGEVDGVEAALREAGFRTIRAAAPATVDGGDVLFTGREFFVGLSKRTNREGAEAIARAFPGFRVTAVPLAALASEPRTAIPRTVAAAAKATSSTSSSSSSSSPALHLKSIVTMAGPDTLLVADSDLGRSVAFYMQDHSGVGRAARAGGKGLAFVLVPDQDAANVVAVNGTILMQPAAHFPETAEAVFAYAGNAGLSVVEVDTCELAKADGALTCCSILLQ
jgi:dimethylargininase